MTWVFYALLAALFASATTIFAKLGMNGVNSHLATALRTAVALLLAWGIVFAVGAHKGISALTPKNWAFLTLSGLSTGLSWICYYRAVSIGPVSRVAPVDKLSVVITVLLAFAVLQETPSPKAIVGCALIAAGTLFMVL